MAEDKRDSKSKAIIILLIIIIILLIAGGVTAVILLLGNGSSDNNITDAPAVMTVDSGKAPELRYEPGVIGLDQNSVQQAYDAAFEKTQDGYITVDFKTECISEDGVNFRCKIGNAPENTADMYITIYLDSSYSEQLYLSGLIRPGDAIESFTSEKKLDPGRYEAILVLTQVEDDHATMKAQTSVILNLTVEN